MHESGRGRRWAGLLVLALLVAVGLTVGSLAYNAGVAHGIDIGTTQAALERGAAAAAGAAGADQGARAALPPHGGYGYGYGYGYGPGYYGYGWHPWHPWGFWLFGPFLFILFWVVVLKALAFRRFRGGPWRHHHGYSRGYRGYRDGRGFREPPVHM
jgi:hypothetical protein